MAKQKKTSAGLPDAPEKKQKVAIYIRVSTTYQIDKDSLPMQRQDLEAYSRLILGIEDYTFFEDAGYSGKNTDRPAFQDMMSRIRKGEFSHVLVWKIDRISRNLLDFASMYKELQKLRVTFVSKNEQFDTSTAIGEAMLKIILVFAELERNMTSERVTATMISRANNGIWNGGRIPYGYSYDADSSTFSIREDEAIVCRLIRDDYLEYHSMTHTSKLLNNKGYVTRSGSHWTPTSVHIIITSPFYVGTYRYNRCTGTTDRSLNPEDEWVMVPNHHPAIFTEEEYESMNTIVRQNDRAKNSPGKQCLRKTVHVFGGLLYCGKCGSKLTSTPGRLHADGFRTTIHNCPMKRKVGCDNAAVTDLFVGEFTLNYILNMLNAKRSFSEIPDPESLERRLLFGSPFNEIDHIEQDGLNEFFNLLSRYKSDDSFVFSLRKPRKKKAASDPAIESLKHEKEKEERALRRLQDLYLYSQNSMSEKDFIIRKSEITSRLDTINKELSVITGAHDTSLSDEDFIKQASHLLIAKQLADKTYIYYKNLAQNVSPEILKAYLNTIVDSIKIADSRITSITFKNGLVHNFIYKA